MQYRTWSNLEKEKNDTNQEKLLQIEKVLKLLEARVPNGLIDMEGVNEALDNIEELLKNRG
tara:strand:+ start:51 stop:233 length:183 start_codon:yes stop_codon:yes gene_type:complete